MIALDKQSANPKENNGIRIIKWRVKSPHLCFKIVCVALQEEVKQREKLDSMLQTDERTLDLSIQNSSNSGDLNTWVMLAYKTHDSTEKEKSSAVSSNCQIWIK